MFNYASTMQGFSVNKVLGGVKRNDNASFRTLYCGPDPAAPERVLVRKLVELNEGSWAYEETRVTKNGD